MRVSSVYNFKKSGNFTCSLSVSSLGFGRGEVILYSIDDRGENERSRGGTLELNEARRVASGPLLVVLCRLQDEVQKA